MTPAIEALNQEGKVARQDLHRDLPVIKLRYNTEPPGVLSNENVGGSWPAANQAWVGVKTGSGQATSADLVGKGKGNIRRNWLRRPF
jgi:hypothetical protein